MASSLGESLYAANLPSVLPVARFGDLGHLVSLKREESFMAFFGASNRTYVEI